MSTIKRGDYGEDVQRLQSILAMLQPGHQLLVVDGRFGAGTDAALRDFQGGAGLPPDGIAGPATWKALDRALASKSDSWVHALALRLRQVFGSLPTGFEKFEFDTAGPDHDEHPLVPVGTMVQLNQGEFVNGWWSNATRWQMNPRRMGPAITPRSVVAHTTDTQPGAMAALLRNVRDEMGVGSGFHFLIGKAPKVNQDDISGGVFQLAPIYRNGNHAGGSPTHGWFKTKDGSLIHPNTAAVGIEIDNAGRLKKVNGKWIHPDSGRQIPDLSVLVDAKGRGWERVTDYQMQLLSSLVMALDKVMPRFDDGVTVVPNGTYAENGVSPEAALPGSRFVGHWTLDPYRKSDPGPQVTEYLRSLYA